MRPPVTMPGRAKPRGAILARGTRDERRAARQGTKLERRSGRVEKRYDKALYKFFTYLRIAGIDMPTSPYAIDETLVAYITFLWEDGDTIGTVGDTISGMQARIPALRKSLPGSWLMLKAWRNKELPVQAPPLPPVLAWGLVGLALEAGFPGVACVFAVAWHCMLRTTEAFSLQASNIVLGRNTSVVTLTVTKKGLRDAVTIFDPSVTALLAQRMERLLPGDRISEVSDYQLRQLFNSFLRDLDAHEHGFRPYSFRRGGATHHFRTCGSMDQTCERGRWESSRTARIYITDGASQLADLHLSATCKAMCIELARRLARSL